MLTFYLLMFAAIFIMVEFSVLRCRVWFFFLNFAWGKGLACFFIATLVLGSGKAVQALDIVCGIYFILVFIVFSIISCVYRGQEYEKVKSIVDESEEKNKAAAQSKNDKSANERRANQLGNRA